MEQLKPVERPCRTHDASQIARAAIVEAERRGIPPEPRAFDVLFGYVEGTDPELRQAVDALLAEGEDANIDALDRIHEEHVGYRGHADAYVRIGAQLDEDLQQIGGMLSRRIKNDGRFLHSLNRARDGMSLFARPSAVRQIMRDLIDMSQSYAEQTEQFSAELEAARAQVEELNKELKALRESAFVDHLTGVANRRRLDMALEQEIARAEQTGPLSFIIADLDRFKRLNDTFGHAVGDSVLKQFARILRENVKGKDVPARYGGEEFAVILPATNLLGARHVAEKIRQQLASRAFVISDTKQPLGTVTASFGVAEWQKGESMDDLVRRADEMLYHAKETGRNRVVSRK